MSSGKRRRDVIDIARFNLKMARKLIDTKSVISYDEQQRFAQTQGKFRAMLSKGSQRVDRYSGNGMMSRRRSS